MWPFKKRTAAAPSTIDEFVKLIVKSGLLDEPSIAALRNGCVGDSVQRFCQYLVDHGVVTRWQYKCLLNGRYIGFFIGHYELLQRLADGEDCVRTVAKICG